VSIRSTGVLHLNLQKRVGIKRITNSLPLIWNLALRDLKGKYRRSFLGWTWSLLNPLSQVAIYWLVFGQLFEAVAPVGVPSGVNSFALFLLCGVIPWNFFGLVTNLGMNALITNPVLIKKVAFPREALVLSQSVFSVVQFLIEMSLVCVVLGIFGSPILKTFPVVIVVMLLLSLFATGIALVLALFAVYFRDLLYLWTVVMQLYFFATPIIWNLDSMAAKIPNGLELVLRNNPMALFIETFRSLTYDGSIVSAANLGRLVGWSVVSFVAGLFIFQSFGRRVPEEI